MFELTTVTPVTLDNFQTRQEHHGEDLVTQGDLKISWTTSNRAIDMLQPGSRAAFFAPVEVPPDDTGEQRKIDLPVDELPRLRLPRLTMPLRLENEQTGMTLSIDHGLGGDSNIVLPMVKAHKFKETLIEGGSAKIECTLSTTTGIDEDAIGKLSVQQQREISIVLLPPEPSTESSDQGTIDGSVDAFLKDHPNAGKDDMLAGAGGGPTDDEDESDSEGGEPDATDTFVAAHAPAKKRGRPIGKSIARAEAKATAPAKKAAAKRASRKVAEIE